MGICRRYLQYTAICWLSSLVITSVNLTSSTAMAQTEAPQCQNLFMSEQAIEDKLKVLATTKHQLNSGYYKDKDVFNMTEKYYQSELSRIIRINPSYLKTYLSFLQNGNFPKFESEQMKRERKNLRIEAESILKVLLKIKIDESFDANVEKQFNNTDIKFRKIISEVISREWLNSDHGTPENNFAIYYLDILKTKIYKGNIQQIQKLFDLDMFNINSENESGFSILMQASYANKMNVIDWVLQNQNFSINKKNQHGFTDLEQLRLLGKDEIANYITTMRPDAVGRTFEVKKRNENKTDLYPEGIPLLSFVEINAGNFKMDDGKTKAYVTLTKPFALMSTLTTQKMWRELVELSNDYLPGKYPLNSDPSFNKGDMNPVEEVFYPDLMNWTMAANELSKMDNIQVQNRLAEIFPDHRKGDEYRLPTDAEWEYVARLGGLANGDFMHGPTNNKLQKYAWLKENSEGHSHPVGLKEPIFINGKPIYDMHGNVWVWIADFFQYKLPGGIDPQGPTTGTKHPLRGGGWNHKVEALSSGYRYDGSPSFGQVGVRFARTRN